MSMKNTILPEQRRPLLKKLIDEKGFVRAIEAHNGLSALIANDTAIAGNEGNKEFDALWESSLTDTASKGLPDAEIVGYESRCDNIRQILEVTNKPLIVDGDTGRDASSFEYLVKTLEYLGVSAVIIEDKVYPKRNSLEEETRQTLEDPGVFSAKISRGKSVCRTDDFMIIARLESLIAGAGIDDAIQRARKYLKAGADGIMIHSKAKTPEEIALFCRRYSDLCAALGFRKPLVCVPTTYNTITDSELRALGVNIVIHANHLLRAAYRAMVDVAQKILAHDRSLEVDDLCATTKEIFRHVGFLDITEKDRQYAPKSAVVIIPAAGKDPEFDVPKALLPVKGASILQRQRDMLNEIGITDINVVCGYRSDLFDVDHICYCRNEAYETTGIAESLFTARAKMDNGFLYINSDIIFSREIISSMLDARGDIVLCADNTYSYHKHQIDKELDLIISRRRSESTPRMKGFDVNYGEIVRIGKKVNKDDADYEFTGIAKFSEKGADILCKVYAEVKAHPPKGDFHEAQSFHMAGFTDIIQELIIRDVKVEFLNVYKGWIEIHDKRDLTLAQEIVA
jgi:phosphoenolpyruvate phosphomutase